MPKKDLLGAGRRKLQPKLQMISNGNSRVNAARAEQMSALRVTSGKLLRSAPQKRQTGAEPALAADVRKAPASRTLTSIPTEVEVNVFVQLVDPLMDASDLPGSLAHNGRIVRARVPLSKLPKLAEDPRVAFVEMGESLKPPLPVVAAESPKAPGAADRRFDGKHKFGEDVLIGIIDVQGFDFSHPDFLDASGGTRFAAIWDQGGEARPHPEGRQFEYGAEFRRENLNAALKAAPGLGVPPYEVERQSQMAEGSHGTHVASIAAGNRGVCRKADIAGVLISLPEADEDRRRSFYDSTRLADAVDYLVGLAASLKKKALSVNISLGTNGHAHDGSGAVGRYLDSVFTNPGRALTVAAGNAGQEEGETPDDFGWIMGRIHTSGKVAAANLAADIDWVVVGNGVLDISENELELWFSPQDRFGVQVKPPSGEWTEIVKPLEFIENRRLADGTFLSVYNELHHPSNGANHIGIYLSPNLDADPVIGVPAGTWTVRLHGLEIRDGRFDGWIERDDPRPVGPVGEKEAWAFPSFFTERSMVDNSTVSSLGCGNRVVTVANLDGARNRINISSSQGPSRDGRTKPDIAAPGTDIVAAKGFSTDGEQWIGMTGTSMASPFVTGVVGLMLGIEPSLTGAQVEGILRSTAKPLPGAGFAWLNDAGYGVIDPAACLEMAARINVRKDLT
jgi:subtilisin family serine protease